MSVSVDDLVASLSSHHVGQDAIDLETLQAQLSQSLYSQPFPSLATGQDIPAHRDSAYAPCNTPTSRTPSQSLSRGYGDRAFRNRSRTTSAVSIDETMREGDESMMEEEEQMVQDLLVPASPIAVAPPLVQQSPSLPYPASGQQAHHNLYQSAQLSQPMDSPSSTFTTTDPFYLAQLNATNSPSPQLSFFAQAGRPAQNSPFLYHEPNNRHAHHGHHPHLHLDTRAVLSTAFHS